ncbi:MAG TPA: DUF1801 domain-containing protein [Thermoanaerobaculia bacterium]|nr:DUF1801 domain-containing protein [Thermoanaerobaculia bacterium]
MKERPVLTVNQWLASVPAERKDAINAVRKAVNKHLPRGYEETVDWGMLAWVVPLATLPNTHNGRPLLLAALGAHTKRMTLYLMSVYGDPKLRREFETAYKRTGKKLDMGGCCVHFKTLDDLPLDVVGNTVARVTVDQYVERYESLRKKKSPKAKAKAKTKAKAKAKRA